MLQKRSYSDLPSALQNANKLGRHIKGSPVFFFLSYIILIIILSITLWIRTRPNHVSSDVQSETVSTENTDLINNWFNVIIPPQNQLKSNKVFKYPEILHNQNLSKEDFSFDRKSFQIENSRFIRLNPYDKDFSKPKILVIGANSAVGSKVASKLKSQNVSIVALNNYIDVDFSSSYAEKLFYNVSLIGAIIVHQPPLFRYASQDGYSYINEIIGNYTDGLMNFLYKRKIPIVYGVTRPYFTSNTNVDYCYGAKLVFLPNVIDSDELYDVDNILLRSVRDCQISGHSNIVLFENSIIESVTAEDAADFLISQLDDFHPGRIMLKGSTNVSIKEAIKMTVPKSCKVTFRKSPHKIRRINESSNKFVIRGDARSLIQSAFSNYSEPANAKPYLSIVVTGRNDHFAEGFENRTQIFLNQIAESLKKVPTASIQLVFVDYATDYPNNSYLYEVLDWPPEIINLTKIIIVPESFHKEIENRLNSTTPFLEYVAKNIGVWRSNGEFVLTMNPDSILSTNFFECISGHNLNEGIFYQTTRFSLYEEILVSNTFEEIIQLNEEPWNYKNYNFIDFVENGRNSFILYQSSDDFDKYLFRAGAGDFLLLSRKLWDAVGGFDEMKFNTHVDNLLNLKMFKLVMGFAKTFLPYAIIHQEHPHLSPAFGSVDKILDVFYQYMYHGRTDVLPFESDRSDWGYQNVTFKELHV